MIKENREANHIVKAIGIGLAIFLALLIIRFMIFGFGILVFLSTGTKDIARYPDIYTVNEIAEIRNFEEISDIKIELTRADLEIVNGEEFKVETNLKKLKVENKNNVIRLVNKDKVNNLFLKENKNSIVKMTIPKNKVAKNYSIEIRAGKVKIEDLKTNTFDLNLGVGECVYSNGIILGNALFDIGAGNINFNNMDIANGKIKLGIGDIIYDGVLKGKNDIDLGIGSNNVNLYDDLKNYIINIDSGLGTAYINGAEVKEQKIGTGKNMLNIDFGIGKTKVNDNIKK